MMSQQIITAVHLLPVLTTPYPKLLDVPIYDSCMQVMCVTAVSRGYSISTLVSDLHIHKNNQITKANKSFARAFVEVLSLMFFYNHRIGWSGDSERAKTTSTEDSRGLLLFKMESCTNYSPRIRR